MFERLLRGVPRMSKSARMTVLVFLGAVVVIRWLFTRPFGYLILAAIAYCSAPLWTGSTPLSASELMAWISRQERDSAIAIATSLLTIIGFIIAFAVANSAWRSQRRTELRLASGQEIYQFFQEAWDAAITVELYAEFLCEAHEIIHDVTSSHENVEFEGAEVQRRSPAFTAARQRLSRMSIEVHALRAKHELVLSEQLLGIRSMEVAIDALQKIASSMWFPAPESANTTSSALAFIKACDHSKWIAAAESSSASREIGAMASNAIYGFFVSDLIKPNASMFNSFRQTTRKVMESQAG